MDEELRIRRLRCTDSFHGNGLVRPAELLASIPPDTEEDLYGEGGAVTDLERYVAELLGKPAAVLLPSGTMAQAATARPPSQPAITFMLLMVRIASLNKPPLIISG